MPSVWAHSVPVPWQGDTQTVTGGLSSASHVLPGVSTRCARSRDQLGNTCEAHEPSRKTKPRLCVFLGLATSRVFEAAFILVTAYIVGTDPASTYSCLHGGWQEAVPGNASPTCWHTGDRAQGTSCFTSPPAAARRAKSHPSLGLWRISLDFSHMNLVCLFFKSCRELGGSRNH